jgi:2-oxoglutarate ferredoxin oxidoreductase subunit alpha
LIKDTFTFLVGGKAGEGVKKAGAVAADIFSGMGHHVFQMDDYMSLIRGGHNFSFVSCAPRKIYSHYMKADLVICFDKRSYDNHHDQLSEGGVIVYNSDEKDDMKGIGIPLTSEAKKFPVRNLMFGVGAVAILCAALGYDTGYLNDLIAQQYPKGTDDNQVYANIIYNHIFPEIGGKYKLEEGDKKRPVIFGNQAIALGAIAGGLNVYYAYPMTPASSLLHYLASQAEKFGLAVIHPENEIAVMNMAVGSSFTGAKTMVGTSGGGFALMVEGFSLAGITEAPVLCVLSMRPGPATGVPTYTEQADLNFALSSGHGEFLRIVASPGTLEEAFYLTTELLDLVWKFQTPGILLTEKHLSESSMTVDLELDNAKYAEGILFQGNNYKRYLDTDDGISPLLFPPSLEINKWNSYEHDELGITTEDPYWISKMHDKRNKKLDALEEYMKKINTVNILRGELPSNIITYGSTTMSVIEATKYGQINSTIVQPVYLNPFPVWEFKEFKDQTNIVVEQSSTGQFTDLLTEKAGIKVKKVIKRYDGRPFDPIELSNEIKEVL